MTEKKENVGYDKFYNPFLRSGFGSLSRSHKRTLCVSAPTLLLLSAFTIPDIKTYYTFCPD
jgi:hypothetical protein